MCIHMRKNKNDTKAKWATINGKHIKVNGITKVTDSESIAKDITISCKHIKIEPA